MRILFFLLAFLSFATQSDAAFKSSSDAVSVKDAWNPVELKDDIVLPMPCGLSLALRPVAISSGALLRDKKFPMGIGNTQNPERQIYERQFDGYVAAPFTLANLPANWQNTLKNSQDASDGLYFIGKYEISRLQWHSVMDALDREGREDAQSCPRPDKNSALPVSEISWFDAQEFLNKYNAWLVANHLEKLPSFKGGQDVGFFRLPTEEEWEYAARAYSKVPQEWWANHDMFRFDDDRTLQDYAVTSDQSPRQAPLNIGSRLANPLGIHDTAGNVSEMVDGFFRMSIADMANGQVIRRLHGAAGGVLTKGGSFRSQNEESLPGSRDEIPIYSPTGTNKRSDLGFRVVLAALNIPNAQRLNELRKEAKNQNLKPEKKPAVKGNTPLEMVASLASQENGTRKKDLERLQAMLQDREAAFASQELKNLEQSFRSLLYETETLRAFGFRYSQAAIQANKIKNMLNGKLTENEKKEVQAAVRRAEADIRSYLQSLTMGANHYKSMLANICSYPEAELTRLFRDANKEYGNNTIFDEHMRQNLLSLAKNVALAKDQGISKLDTRSILKSTLAESHFKSIKFQD